MNLLRTLVVAAVGVAFAAAPAAAQDSRQARWDSSNAGPAESDSSRALLNELNKLVDKAEKERAADTGFLRDLRHLARTPVDGDAPAPFGKAGPVSKKFADSSNMGNSGSHRGRNAHEGRDDANDDHKAGDDKRAHMGRDDAGGDHIAGDVKNVINDVLREILGLDNDEDVVEIAHSGRGLPPGLAKRNSLPPGLAKHVRETGQLPPGLQKRLTGDIESRLPGKSARFHHGDLVILDNESRQIVSTIENVVDILKTANQRH